MSHARRGSYRVTIRYYRRTQQYEIIELEADHLQEALAQATERFPSALLDTADLVEIRRVNPADSSGTLGEDAARRGPSSRNA